MVYSICTILGINKLLRIDNVPVSEHCSVNVLGKFKTNNIGGRKMQTAKLFTIDLTKIAGKGDFNCPKCGVRISPDDRTEKKYRILEAVMKQDELDGVTLQCNRCESQILLTGFHTLSRT